MLPTGFSRADGVTAQPGFTAGNGAIVTGGVVGTPNPAGSVMADNGSGSGTVEAVVSIEEFPDSPTIERAEQGTITHRFRMSWEEALNRINYLGRGLVRTDAIGQTYKLLSSSIQHEQGGTAILTTIDESVSFDLPPDSFQVVPVELGINILKHPRYFYAFLGEGQGSATELKNQMVIRTLQNYMDTADQAKRDTYTEQIYYSLGVEDGGTSVSVPASSPARSVDTIAGTDMAKRAALEIIQKWWRGAETPYIVGYQITWSQFYFRPPFLNPGGYIENPITEAVPELPDYFWSPDYPPTTRTVFDRMAAINPQCYSSTGLAGGTTNISWLRKSDEVDWERTFFKVTRTWIGSAVGFWDTELYTASARPLVAGDFLLINPAKNPPATT